MCLVYECKNFLKYLKFITKTLEKKSLTSDMIFKKIYKNIKKFDKKNLIFYKK